MISCATRDWGPRLWVLSAAQAPPGANIEVIRSLNVTRAYTGAYRISFARANPRQAFVITVAQVNGSVAASFEGTGCGGFVWNTGKVSAGVYVISVVDASGTRMVRKIALQR